MFQNKLEKIKQQGTFRQLPNIEHRGKYIIQNGKIMLNVSSNDYLGIAGLESFNEEFENRYYSGKKIFSASQPKLILPIWIILKSFLRSKDFGLPHC